MNKSILYNYVLNVKDYSAMIKILIALFATLKIYGKIIVSYVIK